MCNAGHVYSLHAWSSCMFVSGSQDKTARLWDLRAPAAVSVIPSPSPGFFTSNLSRILQAAVLSLYFSIVFCGRPTVVKQVAQRSPQYRSHNWHFWQTSQNATVFCFMRLQRICDSLIFLCTIYKCSRLLTY